MKCVFIGNKKPMFYKSLLIKADLHLHEQIADKLLKVLPIGSKILDFGAGEGALSQRLHDLGYEVVSADINGLEFKAEGPEFNQIDFNNRLEVDCFLNAHEQFFDAVIGVEVIEHVHNPWLYIDDLLKMVKLNGLVLISTPNITSWLSRFIFLFYGRFHQFGDNDLSYGHIAPITPWEIKVILEEKNLADIEIEKAGTLPAVYITGFNKLLLINILSLIFRPFMKGYLDGWCILATARKPK